MTLIESNRTVRAGKLLRHRAFSWSARTMQDGVGLTLLHFLQQVTRFQCGLRDDLDTATFPLRQDFIHYWKRAMGAGSDYQPLATPGNCFPSRKRRVAELFAELFGRSLLPFAHFAAVDHDIMDIPLSLDLDLPKFGQSRFNLSMFCCLEFKARERRSKNVPPFDNFALRARRNLLDHYR